MRRGWHVPVLQLEKAPSAAPGRRTEEEREREGMINPTWVCVILSASNDPALRISLSGLDSADLTQVVFLCLCRRNQKHKPALFFSCDPSYFCICCGANANARGGKKAKTQQKTSQLSQLQPHFRPKIAPAVKKAHMWLKKTCSLQTQLNFKQHSPPHTPSCVGVKALHSRLFQLQKPLSILGRTELQDCPLEEERRQPPV